jgi:signal transduction histidine kinase
MSVAGSQLAPAKRPKWRLVVMGVGLIAVAVALTVAWQILAVPDQAIKRELSGLRWLAYFFGSLLFLLLIAGLVLIVILLLREVRLNERQSNFVSAVTHELKTPVASLKLYLDTLQLRDLPEGKREEFYRTMSLDLDRLHATINNVLNAASTRAGVIEAQPLDLEAGPAPRSTPWTRRQSPETFEYLGRETVVNGEWRPLKTAIAEPARQRGQIARGAVEVEVDV